MNLVARLDDIGKPAWIALMIVSFILFWPLGLVVLGYPDRERTNGMLDIGRGDATGERHGAMQERAANGAARARRHANTHAATAPSTSTAPRPCAGSKRKQRQFKEFLDRLRQAKDKAEFDQFMSEMRRRSEGPPPQTGV